MPVRHKNNLMACSLIFFCLSSEGTKNNAIKQINFPINLFEAGRKAKGGSGYKNGVVYLN